MHATGDREDNVGWSGETQENLTQSMNLLQYRKWRYRLTWTAYTVQRLVLWLKLKIPGLWWARWKRSSCDYRHHPVCGYKSGNRCIYGYRCYVDKLMVRGNPARGRQEVTQGAVAILRRKKGAKLCIRSNEFYSTGSWRNWDLNPSAGHTWNAQDASGTKQNSEKKKAIWRHYPKRWTSWAKSLRAWFWGTTTWGNLTTSRLYQQSSMEFGEKICKLKPNMKLRFILLWRRQRHRISYVCYGFGSFSAQCWAKEN